MALNAIPPRNPSKKDCFADLLCRAKKRGMREIQHKKERLNLGKESAVKAPLIITRRIWIHLIFKKSLFIFGQIDLSMSRFSAI
jgi:hypothetical protein